MEALKPTVSKEEAKLLIDEHYGIKVTDIQELNGYDDCNFYCKVDDEKGIVEMNFKVTNHIDTAEHDLLESLNEVALYLFENGINLPVPIKNLKGNYLERIILSQSKTDPITNEKRKHAIRLYTFIPGIIFQKVDYTIGLLENCGKEFAKLNKILTNYSNKKIDERSSAWALERVNEIREFLDELENESRKKMVEEILDEFEVNVMKKRDSFPLAIIHDDLNDQNLIVKKVNSDYELAAILDFNDLVKSIRIFDIAVFCAYCILNDNCSLKTLDIPKYILKSYCSNIEVSPQELAIIPLTMKARLCQSLVLGAHNYKLNPTNEYLLDTAKTGWPLLEKLHQHNDQDLIKMWMS